ncbi:MAG: hypothetical protein NTW19_19820 [Planctomycetota bacterium]|nr:hypothetical protein [Planctomycetota bacterium]
MPAPGLRWYHVTFSTYGSWLPGDPRGFRDKGHRIHSSGDHLHPPPAGEHAELWRRAKKKTREPVELPVSARKTVGEGILNHLDKVGIRILVLAVGNWHVHAQAELSVDKDEAWVPIAGAKRRTALIHRKVFPGGIWGRNGGLKPIRNQKHQAATFDYIARHADEGAWVWTFRDVKG